MSFELAGQQFTAISAGPYFRFNPSISLMVACSTVEEVNTKWKALSEGGTAEEAVKHYVEIFEDSGIKKVSSYGEGEAQSSKAKVNYAGFKLCGIEFSGQADVLFHGSKDEVQRVTEAFLKMKKFDLEALERARLGK